MGLGAAEQHVRGRDAPYAVVSGKKIGSVFSSFLVEKITITQKGAVLVTFSGEDMKLVILMLSNPF